MDGEVTHREVSHLDEGLPAPSSSSAAAAATTSASSGDQQPSNKWLRVLLAVLFALGAVGGSFLATSTICLALVPLFLVGQVRLYREGIQSLKVAHLSYIQALMEILLNIKFVITGEEIRSNESNLILMNHRTRLDWMYFWGVLVRQSGIKSEIVVLKSMLRGIPGIGWGMQLCAFIFIKRHLEDDKKTIDKMLRYYGDLRHKPQILLFPEGTDFTDHTKSVSDRFALKNGWPTYEQVLHPRTNGFTFLMQSMRKYSSLEAVYDVTLAYPYNVAQNESDLVRGNFPREVHFHVQRHPVADLPTTEESLAEWCKERWAEKEETLSRFHKDGQFRDSEQLPASRATREQNTRRRLWWVLTCWTAVLLGITVMLYYSWTARCLLVVGIVFFTSLAFFGGFDTRQVDYYNRFLKDEQNNNVN